MRSKENELNFTDYKQLNCYRYIEENDTIEESFYQSNDSKLCKLFTTCYFLIFYFILFNLFSLLSTNKHSLGLTHLNVSKLKRIFKFSRTLWFFLFPSNLNNAQRVYNQLKQIDIYKHVFFEAPSHRRLCFKTQTTNRYFYSAVTTLGTYEIYICNTSLIRI